MKAGISTWNKRVSPVMDRSVLVLVYDIEEGEAKQKDEIDLCEKSDGEKIEALARSGIEILVCGAISNNFMRQIRGAGIDLVPWVSGSNEMILKALTNGYLGPTEFLMPGCARRQCRIPRGQGRRNRAGRSEKKEGQGW